MQGDFCTAVYERRGDAWVAWSPEHPEAGVIGHTLAEAREQLRQVLAILSRKAEARAAVSAQGQVPSAA